MVGSQFLSPALPFSLCAGLYRGIGRTVKYYGRTKGGMQYQSPNEKRIGEMQAYGMTIASLRKGVLGYR